MPKNNPLENLNQYRIAIGKQSDKVSRNQLRMFKSIPVQYPGVTRGAPINQYVYAPTNVIKAEKSTVKYLDNFNFDWLIQGHSSCNKRFLFSICWLLLIQMAAIQTVTAESLNNECGGDELDDCERSLRILDLYRQSACQKFVKPYGESQNSKCESVAIRERLLAEACFELSARGKFADRFAGKMTIKRDADGTDYELEPLTLRK